MLHSLRRYTTRNMKPDPGVVKLLGLDPEHTKVSSAGGGGCSSASTSKISAKLSDGTDKAFFLKTGSGDDAKVMVEGDSGHGSWLRVMLTS
jgi:protein-ribulosamine 3-kinase